MTPTLDFRGQPYDDDATLGAILRRLLTDTAITEITVVVAWARYRGLRRLRDELLAFKERGMSRIIVGIDEGGATAPGLKAAMAWFTEAYVYHENVPTTFHPKLFLAEGEKIAVLVVGSNNATPGGLWLNHEAALEAGFSLPAESNHAALEGARNYIQTLLDDEAVCLPLTEDRIRELLENKRFRISGQERQRRVSQDQTTASGADDEDFDPAAVSDAEAQQASPFGKSQHKKVSIPALPPGISDELAELEEADEYDDSAPEIDSRTVPPAGGPSKTSGTTGQAAAGAGAAAPGSASPPPVVAPATTPVAAGPTVVLWWDKELPAGDAQQQPNPNTNPTGNLRLTQAKHPIDWRTWFRNVFFATATWVADTDRNGNAIERTTVPMDVTVFGTPLGTMYFDVTHAKHRESGQSNHTTVLHWGPLMPTLRSADYTNDTVTLSRMSDGSYRLEIS